jgi:hypothetical protein
VLQTKSSSSSAGLLKTAAAVASKTGSAVITAGSAIYTTLAGKEPAVAEEREWYVSVNEGTNTDWISDFKTRNQGAITVVTTTLSSSHLLTEIVAILRNRAKSSGIMRFFGSGPSFDPAAVRIAIFPSFAKNQDRLIKSLNGCEMYRGVTESGLAERLKKSGKLEGMQTKSWIDKLKTRCTDTVDMIYELLPHTTRDNADKVFDTISEAFVDQDYELAWSSIATDTRRKQLYYCLGQGRIVSLGHAMQAMIEKLKTTNPNDYKQLMSRFNLFDFRL